jgi:ribonuclease Z
MAKLIFLGTSNAISDEEHENTHLVLVGDTRTVLIDCPNSPIHRFKKAGVDVEGLTDLVLTHFHPDHVGGVPNLLMDLWLMGRKQPLEVHGLQHTLDRIESLMGFYGWSEWPGFFPVNFHRLPEQSMVPVLACEDFRITASLVRHFIPDIGLRIEFSRSGKVLAYSSDTEPCPQLVELAQNAHILIHEASGDWPGHSSAEKAGEVARLAGVKELYLVHYPTGAYASGDLVSEARAQYAGPVTLARDYMVLEF